MSYYIISVAVPDIKKVMDAVELAAKIKREGKGIPKKENFLLAVLTNTINTIHKWSGCKT